jgi:hypothetical protein
VPDLRPRPVSIILCSADADALDGLVPPGHGARTLRVAPDETLAIARRDAADVVARELEDRIAALDPDAVVVDVTDGWSAWALIGFDAAHAFSYLSALDPPERGAFAQGDVARVGAIVFSEDDGITILVPAYWAEHIRERAVADARATEMYP